ncbi:hypothetical protein WUBG_15558 [Wuchereria bancrofti]|uniref:Uncharacterized protein n=1 Tax=Wuchereria bancrofti TaxID=6293 RepID=J9DV30_WUCBA|nr:hypothetical protein WUBG_15558 [Wuchereria bancrofti]
MPGKSGIPGILGLPGNAIPVTANYSSNCRLCPRGQQGSPGTRRHSRKSWATGTTRTYW